MLKKAAQHVIRSNYISPINFDWELYRILSTPNLLEVVQKKLMKLEVDIYGSERATEQSRTGKERKNGKVEGKE
jgi:hypothetical protein